MTIYVGIDGSEGAAIAARWADAEGALRRVPVTAVVAWDLLNQRAAGDKHDFEADYSQQDALDALDTWLVEAVGGDAARDIGRLAVNDLPWSALVSTSVGGDLLVVGARGSGGFLGLRLGSVSEKCLHQATCPIAVIHADGAFSEQPELIVVGVDGSDVSTLALAWALDEARARNATVRAVTAWDGGAIASSGMPGAMIEPSYLEDAAKDVLAGAIDAADTSGLAAPVERRIEAGSAPSSILDAAKDATLIVVGSHGRHGLTGLLLGSASRQVVHHAPCPVVVVPHRDREAPT